MRTLAVIITCLSARAAALVHTKWESGTAPKQQQLRGESERTCGGAHSSFSDFVKKHSRAYSADEHKMRMGLYEARVAAAVKQNCKSNRQWTAGVTHLMDWTEDELSMLKGYKRNYKSGRSSHYRALDEEKAPFHVRRTRQETTWRDLPKEHNWTHLVSVSEPRDQGSCGSCWAFGAETVMRARAEKAGRNHRFSVSQMVACTPNPQECGGSGGCGGATVELGYEYVMKHGLVGEDELAYPEGGGQADCPFNMKESDPHWSSSSEANLDVDGSEVHSLLKSSRGQVLSGGRIGMAGWTKFAENKEMAMVRSLVSEGPVAVAVAIGDSWYIYSDGLMQHSDCDQNHVVNHAVVLYGYGEDRRGRKFWNIKNSWGAFWGEKGNLRLQRLDNEEQTCGWDHQPDVGIGCKGGPEKVWVCGSCGILYDLVVPHFVANTWPVAK